jgi:hypothetical protein
MLWVGLCEKHGGLVYWVVSEEARRPGAGPLVRSLGGVRAGGWP